MTDTEKCKTRLRYIEEIITQLDKVDSIGEYSVKGSYAYAFLEKIVESLKDEYIKLLESDVH